MQINEEREGNVVVLCPVGDMDVTTLPEFEARLTALTEKGARAILWDLHGVSDEDPITLMVNMSQLMGAAFHPEGTWVATAEAWPAAVWPLERRYPQTLRGGRGAIQALAFTPDGHLASLQQDETVRLWNLTPETTERCRVLGTTGVANMWRVTADPRGGWTVRTSIRRSARRPSETPGARPTSAVQPSGVHPSAVHPSGVHPSGVRVPERP